MKTINTILKYKLWIAATTFILVVAACSEKKPSITTDNLFEKTPHQTSKPNPFPFYKNIEIKPGLYFEIVSWGKSADTLGGVLILMSDSLKNNFKSVSAERIGVITDAWNMDMDNDGNPEIFIQRTIHGNKTDLNVYEFSDDFSKISFPGLNNLKGYEGNDKFFIKSGELYRSIPIVEIDSNKKNVFIKTVKYRLSNNTFSSSEVKNKE